MKPRGTTNLARFYPNQEGWCLQVGATVSPGVNVAGLCEKLPAAARVQVLAPSRAAVLERFTLPQAPREDLLAMAQLQLEKLLPYAAEEFVFELQELGGDEQTVEVLALTLSVVALEECCGPIRKLGRGPSVIGVYAQQLAGGVRSFQGVTLLVWMEQGRPFLALVEGGNLLWLEGLPEVDPALAEMELSRALLGAELAGVGGKVQQAIVAVSVPGWAAAVRHVVPGVPLEERTLEPELEVAGNWLPAAWAVEESSRSRKAVFAERLQWVGMAYLAVLTIGFAWLAFQKAGLRRLDQQLAELQPKVELSNARQSRWHQVEPAVDPSRYLVEVLHQAQKAVGPADIRITELQMSPREFSFSGEAASLAEAIEYVSRLKQEPGLSAFQIQSPNPNILPNERAQFRISAKSEFLPTASKR